MKDQKTNSLFRKIASSLWNQAGDPSVYGFIELDVTELQQPRDLLPLIATAVNHTMLSHPELTSFIRWGQPQSRDYKAITLMVHKPGDQADLSTITLEISSTLSTRDVRSQLDSQTDLIRSHRDPTWSHIQSLANFLPHWILRPLVGLYELMIHELGTRFGIRFIPLNPFGSVIISNIGSLGIKKALLPLVPLARASLLMSVGKISEEVKVHQGAISIRKIAHLGVTFDHRLFDGSHAAKMLYDFEKHCAKLLIKT